MCAGKVADEDCAHPGPKSVALRRRAGANRKSRPRVSSSKHDSLWFRNARSASERLSTLACDSIQGNNGTTFRSNPEDGNGSSHMQVRYPKGTLRMGDHSPY